MDAKVTGDFWSDPAIELLSAEQKLAALWCYTSSRTTMIGFVEASAKRFEFETGSPYGALAGLPEAHPKGFKKSGEGIWVRRYIARQFGTGEKLVRNNFCKPILSALRACEGLPVFKEVLAEYPELQEPYEREFSHSPILPKQALAKGSASPRVEQSREEQSGAEEKPALLLRACALFSVFRNNPSRPLDRAQDAAWKNKKNQGAVAAASPEEWRLLEWFYGLPSEEAKFRRQDLAQLLNNFTAEIQRAGILAHNLGVDFGFSPKKKKGAPENWRGLLGEADPEMILPERFEELTEAVRQWVYELEAAKKKKEGGDDDAAGAVAA